MTITATYGPPEKYALTVNSSPITGVNFTVDGFTTRTTNWTGLLDEGAHSVEMPSTWNTTGGDVYTFDKWWKYDSTTPIRTISLTSDMTITAIYALVPPPQWTLHVNSDPITDINFTLDDVTYATNWSDVLTEGNYTIVMPSTWTTVEGDVYNFTQWEDASTSPSRVVSLTSNMTITATYTKLVPPIASFTLSPTEPIVNETVTFDASASSDPDGTIVSYAWDFGDGASDSGAIVEHAYTAAGTYDVSLTVTDNDGLTHTITKSITVEVSPPGIPWYVYVAAGGAAAVIIAAVAFYFLKIKKPKPT
jgi:PKD repeat protein